jgi:uncharacterized repeat protein (TIGR01451 family)
MRVPATVAADGELVYHIHLENRSRAPAHHVLVRNPLPPNAHFVRAEPPPVSQEPELLWQLETLPACGQRDITLVLQPTGEGEVRNCARVQFEHGEVVRTMVSGPRLTLLRNGPAQVSKNETVEYELVVTNSGKATARGLMLSDALPEGLTDDRGHNHLIWAKFDLQPGQSRRVTYRVKAQQVGQFLDQAVVTTAGGLRQEASGTILVGEPQLLLTMKGPENVYLGETAKYTLTVANPGTSPARNVILINPLPAGAEWVGATGGGRFDGREVRWALGTLRNGMQQTVELTLRPQSGEAIVNQATVTAAPDLKDTREVRTVFQGAPGLTVQIDKSDPRLATGQQTTFTIHVVNQGTAPVTRVVLQATVSEHLQILEASPAPPQSDPAGKVVFAPFTVLPTKEVRLDVTVKALKPGDGRLQVELTTHQLTGGPVKREESVSVFAD